MGKYDLLTRKELIRRLEETERSETNRLRDRLDGEKRLAQTLMLMLKNYNGNYEEDIMRVVLEKYEADRAFLFKFDWESGTNSNVIEVNSPGISSEIANLQRLPNEAFGDYLEYFRQGVPLIVDDVNEMKETVYRGPNHIKEVFQRLNLKSAILFPINIFGELWGYVGMETVRNFRQWCRQDVEWLQSFTDVLSIGVSQRLVRAEALTNEKRFTELFRNMPIGYVRHRLIYDENNVPVDYRYLEVNPAFEKQTGIPKERCIGKTARQLNYFIDPCLLEKYERVASENKQYQVDYYSPVFNKWYNSMLYSPQPGEFVSLFYDVTERYKADERIRQNERKLRTIFSNLPIGIFSYDEQQKLVDTNEEAYRILGITPQSKIRRHLAITRKQKEELHAGACLSFDFLYDRAHRCKVNENEKNVSDEIRFITAKMVRYGDPAEKGGGYLVMLIDNTEIHRANRKLITAQKSLTENLVRLSLVLETGEIYPWYMNMETGKIDISEDFYKAFPRDKAATGDYTMQHFIRRVHPEDLPRLLEAMKRQQEEKEFRIRQELRLDIFGEGYIWCELNAAVRNAGKKGPVAEWLGFLTIIQKRKDNERQLIEAMKKAEESDKLKSAFLANVSHEIRTPLNAIVGFSELIATTEDEEEKSYYFDIVRTNNEVLLNLINDILDLSKIESGRIDLKETEVDVGDMCRELCEVHQLRAHPGVEVVFEDSGSPLKMLTDRNRLFQLYSNLMNNAVKNTNRGSIRISYRRVGNTVEFRVRDTGKGIPPEKQPLIFNRFEKLDSTSPGFGLGLSICKSLLETMGGTIHFESEPGKGTEFCFTLPFRSRKIASTSYPPLPHPDEPLCRT